MLQASPGSGDSKRSVLAFASTNLPHASAPIGIFSYTKTRTFVEACEAQSAKRWAEPVGILSAAVDGYVLNWECTFPEAAGRIKQQNEPAGSRETHDSGPQQECFNQRLLHLRGRPSCGAERDAACGLDHPPHLEKIPVGKDASVSTRMSSHKANYEEEMLSKPPRCGELFGKPTGVQAYNVPRNRL